MGRNILFVTTDQQRYDALGCNGGSVARTPTIDAFAANGIVYDRAHPQNVVCMPSRSTMLTGQYVRTHGVWMNGVPLPADAPSVASVLHDSGYRTALFGKAHFEPFLDPSLQFAENRMGVDGTFGPHRGFDHMETATHTAMGFTHYARMMMSEHAELLQSWYRGARCQLRRQRGGRRRHRRRAGVGERGAPRPVSHRLGRATHDRLSRFPARRRRLLRVGLVPRPAPPVGSARLRVASRRLARARPARRTTRATRPSARRSSTPSLDTGVAITTARSPRTTKRRRKFVPAEMTRGSDSRDQRDGPHRERADRRGVRARSSTASGAGVGAIGPTSSTRPITASSRATSGSCSRVRTTATR